MCIWIFVLRSVLMNFKEIQSILEYSVRFISKFHGLFIFVENFILRFKYFEWRKIFLKLFSTNRKCTQVYSYIFYKTTSCGYFLRLPDFLVSKIGGRVCGFFFGKKWGNCIWNDSFSYTENNMEKFSFEFLRISNLINHWYSTVLIIRELSTIGHSGRRMYDWV